MPHKPITITNVIKNFFVLFLMLALIMSVAFFFTAESDSLPNCVDSRTYEINVFFKNEKCTPIKSKTDLSIKYIINLKTGKFHKADCYCIDMMSEHNKMPTYELRKEILSMGYKPCEKCNP